MEVRTEQHQVPDHKRAWGGTGFPPVRKLGWGFVCLLLASTLTACNSGARPSSPPPSQEPIEVSFFTEPDEGIVAGEPVVLNVRVTQGGDVVEDAERVRFEIWRDDEEGHGSTEGAHGHDPAAGTEEPTHHNHAPGGEDHAHHDPMEGNEGHLMLEAEARGEGIYALEFTFPEAGIYRVMYHVDARGFHAMTDHPVVVE